MTEETEREIHYLRNGRAVALKAVTTKGAFVAHLYQGAEQLGAPYEGEIEFVEEVFIEPPTEMWDKRIKELQEKERHLRDTARMLQGEIRGLRSREQEILAKAARVEGLELLEDFLDGKITHYAVISENFYRPEVLPLAKGDVRYDEHLRLLTLYGDTKNRSVEWRLNRYSDGSGSADLVFPCRSEEEAKKVVREKVARALAKEPDAPRLCLVEAADKVGVPVPPEYRKRVQEEVVENNRKKVARARAELEARERDLNKAQASAAATVPPPEV